MGLSTPKPQERQSQPGVTAAFRVCRTDTGELVREDDPRAAFLAYPKGAVVPVGPEELAYHELAYPEEASVAADGPEPDPEPEKMADSPGNKMASKPVNKAAPRR